MSNPAHKCAKKVMSDSLELVGFTIGLVNSVLNLPENCYQPSGCAKTYVQLSGTGRNTVQTNKPLT